MPKIVTFIGWHNSGKTTIAVEVVKHLKKRGYRVAVIKSSSTKKISFDTKDTDTFKYRKTGADSILFVAPDQMVLFSNNPKKSLHTLAHQYFPDVDIVVGEGFKNEKSVPKIEVVRESKKILYKKDTDIIAIVTDLDISDCKVFKTNQYSQLASFIENCSSLENPATDKNLKISIDKKTVTLDKHQQQSLIKTIMSMVPQYQPTNDTQEIELHIKNTSSTQ